MYTVNFSHPGPFFGSIAVTKGVSEDSVDSERKQT